MREFLNIFVYYSVGYCRSNCYYSQVEFDQPDSRKEGSRNIYYKFTLNKKQKVNIRLIQSFSKYLQEKNYSESPVILTTLKLGSKSSKIIASGCPRSITGHKSVNYDAGIFKDLEEGDYLVHIRVKWRQSTNPAKRQAVVGIYC